MKISTAFPSTYLKAADLQGHNVKVTMGHVAMEDIGGDHKPVLYFQGKEKGMVVNKTNANNISQAYGDDTDNWVGKEIVLFSTWVDFQGKSVEAIRVRPPQPKDMADAAQAPADHQAPAQPAGNGGGVTLDDEIPFSPEWR